MSWGKVAIGCLVLAFLVTPLTLYLGFIRPVMPEPEALGGGLEDCGAVVEFRGNESDARRRMCAASREAATEQFIPIAALNVVLVVVPLVYAASPVRREHAP